MQSCGNLLDEPSRCSWNCPVAAALHDPPFLCASRMTFHIDPCCSPASAAEGLLLSPIVFRTRSDAHDFLWWYNLAPVSCTREVRPEYLCQRREQRSWVLLLTSSSSSSNPCQRLDAVPELFGPRGHKGRAPQNVISMCTSTKTWWSGLCLTLRIAPPFFAPKGIRKMTVCSVTFFVVDWCSVGAHSSHTGGFQTIFYAACLVRRQNTLLR